MVAISGGPSLNGSVRSAIRFRGAGGGGTMPEQPSNVAELPTATCTKSTSGASAGATARAAAESALSRTPSASPGAAPRTASSTSVTNRAGSP